MVCASITVRDSLTIRGGTLTCSGYRLRIGECRDSEQATKGGYSSHGVLCVSRDLLRKTRTKRSLWLRPWTKKALNMTTARLRLAETTSRVIETMKASHGCRVLEMHVIERSVIVDGCRLHLQSQNRLSVRCDSDSIS